MTSPEISIELSGFQLINLPVIVDSGGEEVLILRPGPAGTEVQVASSQEEIKDLLEGGLSIADVVFPTTNPQTALSSWGI